jgi:hypothetical protein
VLGGKSVSRHYVHHKSHMDWPGFETGLRCEISEDNHVKHGTTGNLLFKK